MPDIGSPYVLEYRGRFTFAASPGEMWEALEHTERFEGWWSWLGQFRLEGSRLEEGAVLHGVVAPPVPYRMRVRVVVGRCAAPRRLEATVHGDLEGVARLEVRPEGAGSEAEVWWAVEMTQVPMRIAARVARPLLCWGHDRVVEATVAGFRRHLAGGGGAAGKLGPG